MRDQNTYTEAEKLLARELDECLEDDLSFAPPEREIARSHKFSEAFEKRMEALIRESREATQKREIRKHFGPRYGYLAACVLVFVLCGAVFLALGDLGLKDAGSAGTAKQSPAAAEEAAGEILEESAEEEAAPEESPAESALSGSGETEKEGADEAMVQAAAPPQTAQYLGETIDLAKEQEVPETLDYVTTLVNCPVLDEENPELILTIGNIGEEAIRYDDWFTLEVWIDGGWYEIPCDREDLEKWETLEAGMALDIVVDLTQYRIDYNAERYRLITRVNGDRISAEFTFVGAFEETMEEQEAEEP